MELPVDEVVGLMNEADGDVYDCGGGPGLDELAIKFEGVRRGAAKAADISHAASSAAL